MEAARGWLLLGVPEEAGHQLDGIDEAHQRDPAVLVVRAGGFQALRAWAPLQTVARLLCDARPLDPQWPISLALATRHLEGPERAIGILMDAIQAFPDAPGAYYDLACCEAVLGNMDKPSLSMVNPFTVVNVARKTAIALGAKYHQFHVIFGAREGGDEDLAMRFELVEADWRARVLAERKFFVRANQQRLYLGAGSSDDRGDFFVIPGFDEDTASSGFQSSPC